MLCVAFDVEDKNQGAANQLDEALLNTTKEQSEIKEMMPTGCMKFNGKTFQRIIANKMVMNRLILILVQEIRFLTILELYREVIKEDFIIAQ